jgi:metal-responsive CopG/Arc/MetJ family transcriptional regulator
MAENVSVTIELKENQLAYLDEMAKKHNLPDRAKALRCLIAFAMKETDQETLIFTQVRCTNC